MREIEFRALSEVEQGRWIYGFLLITPGNWGYIIDSSDGEKYSCRKATAGQFTGCKDRNQVKIFEGDILKHDAYDKDRRWVVEYRTDSEYVGFVKVCRLDKDAGRVNTFMSWDGCEVIGNIHDNPELLQSA